MKKLYSPIIVFLLIAISTSAKAQSLFDGFDASKGELSTTISYTYENFDQFFLGTEKSEKGAVPFHNEIDFNIVSLYAKYGISDKVSVVLNLPYISAQGNGDTDGINGLTSISGFQNISFGIKANAYKLNFKGGDLNLITGFSTQIPTGYEPNGVLSIGDGAFGVDFSGGLHLNTNSKFFSTIIASYNLKNDAKNNFVPGGKFNVPNSFSTTGKIGYASSFIYVDAWASHTNAEEGVDIGGTGFFGNLPETNVDYSMFGFTVYKEVLPQIGVSLGYSQIFDGRNAGLAKNYNAGITYNFKK